MMRRPDDPGAPPRADATNDTSPEAFGWQHEDRAANAVTVVVVAFAVVGMGTAALVIFNVLRAAFSALTGTGGGA